MIRKIQETNFMSLRGRSNGRSNPDNASDVVFVKSYIQRDDKIAAVVSTLPRNDRKIIEYCILFVSCVLIYTYGRFRKANSRQPNRYSSF